jgi:hypothetical protein
LCIFLGGTAQAVRQDHPAQLRAAAKDHLDHTSATVDQVNDHVLVGRPVEKFRYISVLFLINMLVVWCSGYSPLL